MLVVAPHPSTALAPAPAGRVRGRMATTANLPVTVHARPQGNGSRRACGHKNVCMQLCVCVFPPRVTGMAYVLVRDCVYECVWLDITQDHVCP